MHWLNIPTSFLDSPEFLGAEPIDRATWLCLMRYCVGQENSGRIEACVGWGDRRWQQLVRVTLEEVTRQSDLWIWDGDDMVLTAYPIVKQEEVQQKRAMGSTKSEAKAAAAKVNGMKGGRPSNNPTVNPTETQPITHGKPIERKGKEEEGKGKEEETQPPLKEPDKPRQPTVSPLDLLSLHGRHLDYFRGSDSGRQEALDSLAGALELYNHQTISSAIVAEFTSNKHKVHIRDLLDVIEMQTRSATPSTPEDNEPEPILDMSPEKVAIRARIAAMVPVVKP